MIFRFSDRAPRDGLSAPSYIKPAWLILTIVIATLIGILTLMPAHVLPRGLWGSDKLAHLLAFLALVFPTAVLWPRVSAMVGVLAVAYGGAIEIIQPFTGRSADLADLVADGTGIGLGIILGSSLRRFLTARRTARAR